MLLFLDTETTGKYHFDKPSDHPDQPKIVELAALLCDDNGNDLGSFNVLIDHNIDIPIEASNIHGIMREDCSKYGILPVDAIQILQRLLKNSSLIIGHNISFDIKMIRSMMGKELYDHAYKDIPTHCTMLHSTSMCKLPKPSGRGGYKWPTLAEAYQIILGRELVGAHRAMNDVLACKMIYFEMRKKYSECISKCSNK